ncbi:MAG: DUF3108 domain-containing protein [Flavobacteriaceae bacterium]|nr:DUF3108 domain-containing protein [Flavobacteriaceae bacterium]
MKIKLHFFKILILIVFLAPILSFAQNNNTGAFNSGEWLKYKFRYGFLNAGFASLEVKDTIYQNSPRFLIKGIGWTSGMVKLFYKVEDHYHSVIDKQTLYPELFRRRVNEGGYIISKDIRFYQDSTRARVTDYKRKKEASFDVVKGVQDMISSMYFIRNTNLSGLKINQEIAVYLFYDQKLNNFKFRFLGKEVLSTKFGKINTLKFKPFVESGRVFKGENSVVVWVTDDKNKIPVKIKADLVVGSLKAELVSFKGLANDFPVIFD